MAAKNEDALRKSEGDGGSKEWVVGGRHVRAGNICNLLKYLN